MEFKPKNREWVKNAAIIFLAVLLVLTFFSNTIMNYSLPQVATQMVTSGSVTALVRGTGTVEANGSHQVKADQTREIRSVMIREGQEVQAGDVLFVLGEGDSEELEEAQETLRQLQLSYQRSAISAPVFNYNAQQRHVDAAKETLDAAKEAEEAARLMLENSSHLAQADIDRVTKNLQEANDTYQVLAERADQLTKEAQDAVDAALAKYNQVRKDLGLPEVDGVSAALALKTGAGALSGGIIQLTAGRPQGGVKLLGSSGASETPPADPTETDPPQQSPSVDISADPQAEPAPDPVSETAPGSTPEDQGGGDGAGDTGAPGGDNSDNSDDSGAGGTGDTVNTGGTGDGGDTGGESGGLTEEQSARLEQARQDLVSAQLALEMLSFPELTAAKANVDRCQAEYDDLFGAEGANKAAYDQAVAARKEAEDAYYELKDALDTQKITDSKSSQLSALEMADISAQIEKQKEKISELSGGEGNQITANVSGIVQSIEVTAGDTMIPDQVLCTIEVPDMGYTLSFSVTNEQARRLNPGDTATVSNYYWGSQIVATLATIRTDPKNPQTNKLLTFDLEGDVTAGAEISLSVGQRSSTYDTVVPNSAIRTDSNGSFVLKIEARSSPLGNRYIARRVAVEVLASDDINSAVTGDFNGWGEYVITTSNAPVNSGDMVKMADN